ncbi:hypothetical protein [Limosilactobacillus reuteri]|uniref:hypothetical protein n=1 Tax=Limosilactobacillus reuteri TaxID=1598 RepID=UPI001783BB45|nr:hypothetical protein [Limosilactobacillus reuteri]MCC4358754.1 hypothetical protein [Limosilactobacillus reuteri]MCC4363426.1 hypothetical protein [Limosilactobacillus reuteri]MCC4365234.1 hypothetical protein [Limosilactobacillus reuteri]MCC4368967.1 hypothetical protein [Limosilactobacillus reuteri]
MEEKQFKSLQEFKKIDASTMKKICGGTTYNTKFAGYKSNGNPWSWLFRGHK